MTDTNGFVPLLVPRDPTELELAKGLLDGAEIPYAIAASDRVEMMEVYGGPAAEGMRLVLVPAERHDEAVELFLEAWGPDTFEPWTPPAEAPTVEVSEFVPLLIPKDNIELELGRGLLEGGGIPFATGASDRVEMLKVFGGASASGLHILLIPADRLDEAVALFEQAWGPETFAGRDPRP